MATTQKLYILNPSFYILYFVNKQLNEHWLYHSMSMNFNDDANDTKRQKKRIHSVEIKEIYFFDKNFLNVTF